MREPTYFVLAALLDGPLHGYAIIKRAAELSGGRVRMATGTLYTALDRLTADEPGDPRASQYLEAIKALDNHEFCLAGLGLPDDRVGTWLTSVYVRESVFSRQIADCQGLAGPADHSRVTGEGSDGAPDVLRRLSLRQLMHVEAGHPLNPHPAGRQGDHGDVVILKFSGDDLGCPAGSVLRHVIEDVAQVL